MGPKRVTVEVLEDAGNQVAPFVVYQPIDPWLFRSFDPKQDVREYEVCFGFPLLGLFLMVTVI